MVIVLFYFACSDFIPFKIGFRSFLHENVKFSADKKIKRTVCGETFLMGVIWIAGDEIEHSGV